jgi:hypothetical protein
MPDKPITPLTVFGAGHGDEPTFEEVQAALIENSVPMPTPMESEEMVGVLDGVLNAIDSLSCGDDLGPCELKHCPNCGGHYKMQIFSYPGPCCEGCRKQLNGDNEAYRMTAL